MRHQRSGKKLGRDSAHRKALYANLTGALIEHGRIKTTVTKAKAVKPIAEQMITLGRRGDLHARRQATAFLRSKDVVHKLFAEVAPRFEGRPGGYTADREDRPALRRRRRHGLPRARRLDRSSSSRGSRRTALDGRARPRARLRRRSRRGRGDDDEADEADDAEAEAEAEDAEAEDAEAEAADEAEAAPRRPTPRPKTAAADEDAADDEPEAQK